MKTQRLLQNAALCGLVISHLGTLRAETRVFTDTAGRTLRGELVSVNGDFVTIKQEPGGQNHTLKATNFSEVDIEFFKKNGLKATTTPPPAPTVAGTPANTAPMRLTVKIYSGKQEQNSKYYYEKEQKVSYKVDIKNAESKRDLEKAHGVIMALAKVVRYNDQTQVVAREEFDCTIKALDGFVYDMQKPVRLRYYADGFSGLRASGYLFVLKDSTGKIINATGSSDTVTKNAEAALKLKVNDVCGKDYKFMKEGTTSYFE